jgi:hypothetical protein
VAKVAEPPLATGMDIAREDETAAGAVSAAAAAHPHFPGHVAKPWTEEPDAGIRTYGSVGASGSNPRGDPTGLSQAEAAQLFNVSVREANLRKGEQPQPVTLTNSIET